MVLNNATLHLTILFIGFGLCARGLYEVWRLKQKRVSSVPPERSDSERQQAASSSLGTTHGANSPVLEGVNTEGGDIAIHLQTPPNAVVQGCTDASSGVPEC